LATLVCPRCRASVEWPAEGRPRCPKCDAWWSYAVRRPDAPPRPLLLTLMALFLSLFALVFILLTLVAALGPGPYLVDGEPATRGEFLAFLLFFALPALLAAPAAHGIWRDRRWSRAAVLIFWACAILGSVAAHAATGQARDIPLVLIEGLFAGVLLGWHLYVKPNVARYYDAL
jgi:hypothetical protein